MAAASPTTTDQDIQRQDIEGQSKPQNESQELPTDAHLANKENSDLRCRICSKFFTDARTLSCGHDFCFPCLVNVQKTDEVKSCHICKELTIPSQEELKMLIPNQDVNERVGKAMFDLGETSHIFLFSVMCYGIISLIFKLNVKSQDTVHV